MKKDTEATLNITRHPGCPVTAGYYKKEDSGHIG